MTKEMFTAHVGVLLVGYVTLCTASAGDRSYVHHACLRKCRENKCSTKSVPQFTREQPVMERVLGWSCEEECDYQCMWNTVEAFKKDRQAVPQFHGKWPFVRLWGIQEPASVLFSILNGLSHIYMLCKFRQRVSKTAPLYWLWHSYALVCIHAWTWSTIFHTRDRPFTEHMDYFCAVSLVTFSFYTLFVRLLGTQHMWKSGLVGLCFLAFYTYHVFYLAFVRFDYGYNMKVNVLMGVSSTTGWVFWGMRVKHKQPYVIKGMGALLIMNTLVLLEVLDFPPIWWILDAHSLWHAGTSPLAFLWYSFVIDDCLYMHKQQQPHIGEKQD